MLKLLTIIILFSFLLKAQGIKEQTEELLRGYYSIPVTLEQTKYRIPLDIKKKVENAARQKFFAEDIYIYKIFSGSGLEGIAMLDNVYGKSMPITFLVLFDPSGKIKSAEVVKYREQYGGAVQNKKWTDQFRGKDSSSGYKPGEDINTISGATISVNSVSAGIRKLTLLFNEIKDKI